MNFEIEGENQDEDERPLRLALRRSATGGVALVVVDDEGELVHCGNILVLEKDGIVTRLKNVSPFFGLQLDGGGCIRIRD